VSLINELYFDFVHELNEFYAVCWDTGSIAWCCRWVQQRKTYIWRVSLQNPQISRGLVQQVAGEKESCSHGPLINIILQQHQSNAFCKTEYVSLFSVNNIQA